MGWSVTWFVVYQTYNCRASPFAIGLERDRTKNEASRSGNLMNSLQLLA